MIRIATANDKDAIMRMIGSYRNESPLDFHKTTSLEHAGKIVDAVFLGAGVCFVAEDTSGVHGMLLAIKNPNIWNPEVMALHELVYWVDVNKRGTRSGYRLLKEYCRYGEDLKQLHMIEYFTISKMVNSPDLDYGRFGFTLLESMWEQ
jgi:hypothetical protein